jgi:hypothetical protein
MKSHKIERLEFVSNKIEGGTCKRGVIWICFGHPTKENEIVWGSPWETAMAGVGASMGAHGELAGEGRGLGPAWGGAGGCRGGCYGGSRGSSLLHEMEKGRRKEKERRKEKDGKEKKERKKYEKFSNLEIF